MYRLYNPASADPIKFLERFLEITEDHREKLNAADWTEEDIRAHLSPYRRNLDAILTKRTGGLRIGYRER